MDAKEVRTLGNFFYNSEPVANLLNSGSGGGDCMLLLNRGIVPASVPLLACAHNCVVSRSWPEFSEPMPGQRIASDTANSHHASPTLGRDSPRGRRGAAERGPRKKRFSESNRPNSRRVPPAWFQTGTTQRELGPAAMVDVLEGLSCACASAAIMNMRGHTPAVQCRLSASEQHAALRRCAGSLRTTELLSQEAR
ncbi:uncharacterized protein LOC119967452 isoform X2 [Scyliorhinus canicula]|uniref:uncharacterized protein LOC119967452 isoform X2 n=1 Tax=Scyliorhinus canicula TaxID=7830 RepID=UPI0018F66065|nr:uncharacterized protein LOC119967452 isoform X2 [Scyliorhinus canicula]